MSINAGDLYLTISADTAQAQAGLQELQQELAAVREEMATLPQGGDIGFPELGQFQAAQQREAELLQALQAASAQAGEGVAAAAGQMGEAIGTAAERADSGLQSFRTSLTTMDDTVTRVSATVRGQFDSMSAAVEAASARMNEAMVQAGRSAEGMSTRIGATQSRLKDGTLIWSATATNVDEAATSFGRLERGMMGLGMLPGGGQLSQVAFGLNGVTTAMEAIGAASAGVAAGAVAVGALTVAFNKAAADFEASQTIIRNNADLTDADFATMEAAVKHLASTTGSDMTDVGQGFRQLTNEGFSASEAVQLLTAANELAVATGAKVADTAREIGASVKDYGFSTSQATDVENALYVAQQQGNLTQEELASSAQRLIAANGALGGSFADILASLDSLTRLGIPADQAVMGLMQDIQHLVAPTPEATKLLQQLSAAAGKDMVSDFSQAGLASKGLGGVLQDLRSSGVVSDQALEVLFGHTRGGIPAIIESTTGWNDYRASLDRVQAALNGEIAPATEALTRQQETEQAAMSRAGESIKNLAIDLGDQLKPALTSVVTDVGAAARALDEGAKSFDAMQTASVNAQGGLSGFAAEAVNDIPGIKGLGDVLYGVADAFGALHAAKAGQSISGEHYTFGGNPNIAVGDVIPGVPGQIKVLGAKPGEPATLLGGPTTQVGDQELLGGGHATVLPPNWQTQIESTDPGLKQFVEDTISQEHAMDGLTSALAHGEETVNAYRSVQGGAAAATRAATAAARSQADVFKEALQQEQDAVSAAQNRMEAYKTTIDTARSAIEQLASTPLQGSQAYSDREEAIQEKINRLQLEKDSQALSGQVPGAPGVYVNPGTSRAQAGIDAEIKHQQELLRIEQDKEKVDLGPQQYQIHRQANLFLHPEASGADIMAAIQAEKNLANATQPLEQAAQLQLDAAKALLDYGKQLLADATRAAQIAQDQARSGGANAPLHVQITGPMVTVESLITSGASEDQIQQFLDGVGIHLTAALRDSLSHGVPVPVRTKGAA